jgi:hypothetical protein
MKMMVLKTYEIRHSSLGVARLVGHGALRQTASADLY